MTAQQAGHALRRADWELDFGTFCKKILNVTPNTNDIWQREKWDNFQAMCKVVARISPEHLTTIFQLFGEKT